MVIAGHVGGTCGLGMVPSAADVLWMSVVAWDVRSWWSMCLAWGGVGGEGGVSG